MFDLLKRITILLCLSYGIANAQQNLAPDTTDLILAGAQTRIDSFSDVAALGGTSIGSPYGTSFNPAAATWDDHWKHNTYFAPRWFNTKFDSGHQLRQFQIDAIALDTSWGWFYPSFVHAKSSNPDGQGGVGVDLDFAAIPISWSKKLTPSFSAGATITLSQSDSTFSFDGLTLAQSETDGVDLDIVLGMLFQPKNRHLIGLTLQSGSTDSRNTVLDPILFQEIQTHSTVDTDSLRLGYSYNFGNDRIIFTDIAYFDLSTNTEQQSITRYAAGIQYPIHAKWVLRLGGNIDSEDHQSFSMGAGFYPNEKFGIEFAYQENGFPEFAELLGDSPTWSVSGFWLF